MIYGVFAAAMIEDISILHAGEKNVATGLSDPMWNTNVCLLLDQAE